MRDCGEMGRGKNFQVRHDSWGYREILLGQNEGQIEIGKNVIASNSNSESRVAEQGSKSAARSNCLN